MDMIVETLARSIIRSIGRKARAEHEARQRSNGHVRGSRLDGVADLGMRAKKEARGSALCKNVTLWFDIEVEFYFAYLKGYLNY